MQASLGMGFEVGHWTAPGAVTGCTVILCPPGNVAACDVRGSSPSSRELPLLRPEAKLTEIHAVLLTGGSAFGLAAADGVMTWLEERGIGYQTATARVPIVPAAVILDGSVTDPSARPGPAAGKAACEAAAADAAMGRVGAGAGATAGKWAGFDHRAQGGLGIARVSRDGLTAAALAVANPVGDIVGPDGSVVAGTSASEPSYVGPGRPRGAPTSNTVLAVVAVEATLDKRDVAFLAARGSDGITIAVRPAHTRYDGDVVFAVAAPSGAPATREELDVLGHLSTEAVAAAIRVAVAPS